ncbi:MAG: ribbon-helix-helix domain-containing protein [Woeseiaceae bacterium]|nr:ribbon-helix-helix domain-containing protein [Hyphomicrobiales bacterium]
MNAITVRLDKKLEAELKALAKRTGRPKSELIRDALRRQLAIARFQELRQKVAPFAEARGWLTDEDVFQDLS